jgi:predicted esterase
LTEHAIATTTHGRYLIENPELAGPPPVLAGFHGYGEHAEIQLERLCAIQGSEKWLIVSVQGLHRFYERRTNRVVAGWMTSQDREYAIADNIAYVNACIEAACPSPRAVVFAGFSQGVAMAFRAAVHAGAERTGVIAVGGDVPPEIDPAALGKISAALIVRGAADEWYKDAQFDKDRQRLSDAGVEVRAMQLDCGHEWTPEFSAGAAEFLADFLYNRPR